MGLKGSRDIFFGKILGIQKSNIGVTATAIAAPISGLGGMIPFAIEKSTADTFTPGGEFDLYSKFIPPGQSKNPNEESDPGNWGTVNFEDTGSAVPKLTDWTQNGYDGTIQIGQTIWTAPGAGLNSNPFKSALQGRISTQENKQYVTVPVIADGMFTGSQEAVVIGFIAIEIITVQIQGQDMNVTAKFYGTIETGDIDPDAPNYGLQGLRLIE